MNNIGYAILKKTSILTIDSNGLFDDLQLSGSLNSLFPLIEIGQQLLCFKRVASRKSEPNIRDAYSIILLEGFNNGSQNYILGSAICFKGNVVNEDKIIDGVQYLLSRLKHRFKEVSEINDQNLGVLLPSTNKDFKIFKEEKLVQLSKKLNLIGSDTISFKGNDAKSYLHYFQKHEALGDVSCLLLGNKTLNGSFEGTDLKGLQIKTLINQFKETQNKNKAKSLNEKIETSLTKPDIDSLLLQEDKILKNRNLFRFLTILFFCLSFVLTVLLITKKTNSTNKTTDSSIYEVGDDLFISYNGYNVNVRSSPNTDFGDDNVKNTLSDGDKVFLLGFDKATLWAKIRYDQNDDIGYVSNRLISKQIATSRVKPIYKKAIINHLYSEVPIYTSPAEISKTSPEVIDYLNEGDKILVKNKDIRLNSYSISFEKNTKVYHGYIERKYFDYQ